MTGFNHALTGISIAIAIKDPVVAAAVAFASHFVLDGVPHFGNHTSIKPWTKSFKRLLIIDGILCFSVYFAALFFLPEYALLITIGAFFATLPDFLWIIHYRYGINNWFFDFHHKIQWGERPWGFYIELPYFICVAALLVVSSMKMA